MIACARKALTDWDGSEPQSGYEFLGLLAFADPLRDGVAESVRLAQNAGIRIIMMTGDHPGAAQAIAEQAGLSKTGGQVVLGDELAALLASDDQSLLDEVSVVARCLPKQIEDIQRPFDKRRSLRFRRRLACSTAGSKRWRANNRAVWHTAGHGVFCRTLYNANR